MNSERSLLKSEEEESMSRRIAFTVACAGVVGGLFGSFSGAATRPLSQDRPAQLGAGGEQSKLAGGVWHRTFSFTPRMSLRIPASWDWVEDFDEPRWLEFSPSKDDEDWVDVLEPRKVYNAAGNLTYLRPDLIAFFRRNKHLHLGPTSAILVGGFRGRKADGVASSHVQCNDQPFQNTGTHGVPLAELLFHDRGDPDPSSYYDYTYCLDDGLRFRLIDLNVRGNRIVFIIAHRASRRGKSFIGTVEHILRNARFTIHKTI
jgi:hypothetical protein